METCQNCKKVVYNIPGKKHVCDFSSGILLTCPTCGKEFTKQAYLKKHIKIVHLRVVNHRCAHCDKGFFSATEKRVHERIHTNEKPLRCDMCDYSGRSYSLLAKHKECHTTEKKYPCIVEDCGKEFKRYTSLVKHKKLHHAGKNFDCDECPGKYRTQAQLTTHKRQIHYNKHPSRKRSRSKKVKSEVENQEVLEDNDEVKMSPDYSNLFGMDGGY